MFTTALTRRKFLQSTAAAGAALAMAPHVRAQSANEINMIGWNSPVLMDLFARAESEIGVKINYDVLPSKWDDVMQKITLWGQTGYDGLDVMFADDLIGGLWGMNGWAEDLSGTDAWTKNSADTVQNIADLNNAAGGVYRAFFTMGLEPFFYNKSLVKTAPTTWEEMVEMAKAVTDADAGVYGWRPLGGEGHAFNTVLLMLNQAGGDLSSLSDPNSLKAFQFMSDWVQKEQITPGSTVSEDNAAVEALAAAGKAGMWWTYEGGLRNIIGVEGSTVTKETLGVSPWPAGPAGNTGLVHGWGVMLPKASKKKEAAIEVINWISSPQIVKEICAAQSAAPPYRSMFEDADIKAKVPALSLDVSWSDLIAGAKFREPIISSPQVTQLWSMFDKLGSYILSGQRTPEDAQRWAADEYSPIKLS